MSEEISIEEFEAALKQYSHVIDVEHVTFAEYGGSDMIYVRPRQFIELLRCLIERGNIPIVLRDVAERISRIERKRVRSIRHMTLLGWHWVVTIFKSEEPLEDESGSVMNSHHPDE